MFWKRIYKSKYTGAEIDDAIGQVIEGGGGGGSFAINITWDETEERYKADKTFTEIKQAAADGKYVYVFDPDDNLDYNTMPLTGNKSEVLVFSGVDRFDGNSTHFAYQQVQISSNNFIVVWNGNIDITPDPH